MNQFLSLAGLVVLIVVVCVVLWLFWTLMFDQLIK